jgi:vitamin B12 transporter
MTGGLFLSLVVLAQPAHSQTQLPPIVVQGTSIEPPRPAQQPAASAAPAPSAASAPSAPPSGAGSAGATGTGDESEGQSAPGLEAGKVGTAVSVVTQADLKRRQVRDAGEALRNLPGVTVNRTGSISGLTQVRIRGAEGNHTLVLIDGIEANDATTGEYDFASLLVDDIERIEVIRGAQSGLYGSGALGGVINILTRGGRGPLTVAVKGEAGSFGTSFGAARVSGGNDNAWASVSLQQRRSAGFNVSPFGGEADGSRLGNFSLKAGVRPFESLTAEVVLRNTQNRHERDGYGAFALGALATAFDDLSKTSTDVWQAGVNVRWDMLGGRLSHVFRANSNRTNVWDDDVTNLFVSRNRSEAAKYGYLATLRFDTPLLVSVRHIVTGLVEKEKEAFTPQSDFADGLQRERGRIAVVGEHRLEIAERLFLSGSVRRDDNDVLADFTTWRTSASLKLGEWGLRPHASAGTGIRLPTLFEQYGFIPAFFTPNPALTPEKSLGWDAGLEVTLLGGRAVIDVTYFAAELTNKINGTAPGPGFTLTAVNMPGVSTREGIEVASQVKLTPALTLGAAYTHLEARTPAGEREIRRPVHSGRADLNYAFDRGRGNLNLGVAYNGAQDDRTTRVAGFFFGFPILEPYRLTLDDYWLVSAAASYKLQPGVEIFGRVENAFDARYQEIFGYNTPGVAAYAGLRLTYQDTARPGESRRP